MNKQDFIKRLMDLYPDTFKLERKEHYKSWFELYEVTIGNHWDYDKLMRIFAKEYKSVVTPPHPSFFKDFANDVKLKKAKPLIIEHELPEAERLENLRKLKKFKEQLFEIIYKE